MTTEFEKFQNQEQPRIIKLSHDEVFNLFQKGDETSFAKLLEWHKANNGGTYLITLTDFDGDPVDIEMYGDIMLDYQRSSHRKDTDGRDDGIVGIRLSKQRGGKVVKSEITPQNGW